MLVKHLKPLDLLVTNEDDLVKTLKEHRISLLEKNNYVRSFEYETILKLPGLNHKAIFSV